MFSKLTARIDNLTLNRHDPKHPARQEMTNEAHRDDPNDDAAEETDGGVAGSKTNNKGVERKVKVVENIDPLRR